MLDTTGREASTRRAPPAKPRLLMQRDDARPAPLDGGWWPRSADPAAELPGLVLDLDKLHGRITRVLLGAAGWNASRPSRLRMGGVGGRVVRLGWFASMPAGLLTAISASDQRTDLVTIPPHTSEQDAAAAMEQAAQAGNREHAPAILAAITATGTPEVATTTPKEAGSIQIGVWEWEGGHLHDQPGSAGHVPSLSADGPGSA
jgi:hypothetical protein